MEDNRLDLLVEYLKDNTDSILFEIDENSNFQTELFFNLVSNGIEVTDEDIEFLNRITYPNIGYIMCMEILGATVDFYCEIYDKKVVVKATSIDGEELW